MAGSITDDYEINETSSVVEGMTSEERCQSSDSISEWRFCEQVENETPSTSPPFWDTDSDDDGEKPSMLYGRHTWKIENFLGINKRELKSEPFEAGGQKWYILIYPQGCDVCNHLSLFLCVANHDKLLPGWSHFAQFTIAVVNKDSKKSKYSDTLHRFWKKEHDWGWKKFMELSKVQDGFLVGNVLVIKAQVQVIREKAHHPFRCLDRHYRRELLRVYITNIEQAYRRSVDERRSKLSKLIEDKLRWSSFRAFWLGMDPNKRHHKAKEKADAILKVVVKHFFIEKDVTSTLVMDSLYSGLKALECQSKSKRERIKLVGLDELPPPMVHVDQDMFVLADDVMILLERVVQEPLPFQSLSLKDDKGSQNRTKDTSCGEEVNKDSIERDERRLTELGRRTLEIFVLDHVFSKIEVAYQEAVALKRQEELIREEEAAWLAENELKGKRGAAEKEKRSKKKQSKQKRNSRKGRDKEKDEKLETAVQEKLREESSFDQRIMDDLPSNEVDTNIAKLDNPEQGGSEVSDNGDDAFDGVQRDLDDRSSSPVTSETEASEVHLPMEAISAEINDEQIKKRTSFTDDSSSTCSTDSVPSTVMNIPFKGSSSLNNKVQTSPNRGKNMRNKDSNDRTGSTHAGSNPLSGVIDSIRNISGIYRASRTEHEAAVPLKDQFHFVEKEQVVSIQKKQHVKAQIDIGSSYKMKTSVSSSLSSSYREKPLQPERSLDDSRSSSSSSSITSLPTQAIAAPTTTVETTFSTATSNASSKIVAASSSGSIATITSSTAVAIGEPAPCKESPSNGASQTDNKPVTLAPRLPRVASISKTEAHDHTIAKSTSASHVSTASRSSSALLVPATRPTAPVLVTVPASPLLSLSVSAAGRLDNNPSPSAPSYIPQSYRNATIGRTTTGASSTSFAQQPTSLSQGTTISQSPLTFLSSTSMLSPLTSARKEQSLARPRFTYGSVKPEAVNSQNPWRDDSSYHQASISRGKISSSNTSDIERVKSYENFQSRSFAAEIPTSNASYQAQATVADEFPHIGIINDLLEEEQSNGKMAESYQSYHHEHAFGSPFYLPGSMTESNIASVVGSRFDPREQYFDEGFARVYGSLSAHHGLREGHFLQVDPSAYANGQADRIIQKHWPYGFPNPATNFGIDANGFSLQRGDYSNLATGVDEYSIYHHANGP